MKIILVVEVKQLENKETKGKKKRYLSSNETLFTVFNRDVRSEPGP